MANDPARLRDHSAEPSSEDRLNSWKEIADAPEPQPQMLAPIATAISIPIGTNLRMPLFS
jgi:hypothetical protein